MNTERLKTALVEELAFFMVLGTDPRDTLSLSYIPSSFLGGQSLAKLLKVALNLKSF